MAWQWTHCQEGERERTEQMDISDDRATLSHCHFADNNTLHSQWPQNGMPVEWRRWWRLKTLSTLAKVKQDTSMIYLHLKKTLGTWCALMGPLDRWSLTSTSIRRDIGRLIVVQTLWWLAITHVHCMAAAAHSCTSQHPRLRLFPHSDELLPSNERARLNWLRIPLC